MTDAEVIRHLAEKVMGWKESNYIERKTPLFRFMPWMGEMVCRVFDSDLHTGRDWNPLESIADVSQAQAVVLAGPHRIEYINRMNCWARGGEFSTAEIYERYLTAPASVRSLAMYRATGGAA